MSLTAQAIRLMAEKGLSALDIAEIADALDCAPVRSGSAERMARKRARDAAKASQSDVTCDASQSDVTCDASQNEAKKERTKEKKLIIYTPETSNEVSSPKRSRRKPETPLPDNFPTDEQISEAAARCDAAGAKLNIRFQAERFRNHAQTTDRRCRDWAAAWRNWVSNAIERAGGVADGQPPGKVSSEHRASCIEAFKTSGIWHDTWGERPSKAELEKAA